MKRLGTTSKVTTCGRCGKRNLKKTIVFEHGGKRLHLGEECARAHRAVSVNDARAATEQGHRSGLKESEALVLRARERMAKERPSPEVQAAFRESIADEEARKLERSLRARRGRLPFLRGEKTEKETQRIIKIYVHAWKDGFRKRLNDLSYVPEGAMVMPTSPGAIANDLLGGGAVVDRRKKAHRSTSDGAYRVAYLERGERTLMDGDFTLEGAKKTVRYFKRRGYTAWVEDPSGRFVPVPGTTRKPATSSNASRRRSHRASSTPTPGFNRRIQVAFTTDRRGRPVAYYFSPSGNRWIRTSYAEAKIFVEQGTADEVRYSGPLHERMGK